MQQTQTAKIPRGELRSKIGLATPGGFLRRRIFFLLGA